jgi:hypothetical protein
MDYLINQRYIARGKTSKSKKEKLEDVETKKCESCTHYDFYFCKALDTETAPRKSCIDELNYVSKLLFSEEKSKDGKATS